MLVMIRENQLKNKKLLGIVVLGLLWCNVGFARVVD